MNRSVKLILIITFSTALLFAANPGLPFTEHFSDQDLMDSALTTADWNTDAASLSMQKGKAVFLPDGTCGLSAVLSDSGEATDIAVGDLNMDGLPDIVIANSGAENLIYYNNGNAGNPALLSYPFDSGYSVLTSDTLNTQAIAIADLNGDGFPDIVEGNDGFNFIYLSNGTSDPFASVSGIQISSDSFDTEDLVLADVNQDGHIDICTGERNNWDLVYINNGTADPFNGVTGIDISADNQPTTALAAADLNQDGYPDLVAAHYTTSYTNRYYINNKTSNPFPTGGDIGSETDYSTSIAVGDFDANGNIDIIVGNVGMNMLYFHNNTATPFTGSTVGITIDAAGDETADILALDFNHDGALDVVSINTTSTANRVYISDGDFDPFNSDITYNLTISTLSSNAAAACDFDRDGIIDFVIANGSGETNRYIYNLSSQTPFNGYTPSDITADSLSTVALAAGDVNNDGLDDIVTAESGAINYLYINQFTSVPFDLSSGVALSDLGGPYNTSAIILADINRDGLLDAVAGNQSDLCFIYFNDGDADPFSVNGTPIASSNLKTRGLDCGDVDNDGDIDLVLAINDEIGSPNKLFLHDGSLGLTPYDSITPQNIDTDMLNTYAIKLGDLNNDGYLDVVTANYIKVNRYYINTGTSTPFDSSSGSDLTLDIQNSTSLDLADFNRDGHLDVVFGNLGNFNAVFLNDGEGDPFDNAVEITLQYSSMLSTTGIKAIDIDFDGDIDVVASNTSGQDDLVYLNNGSRGPDMFEDFGIPLTGSGISSTGLTFGRFFKDGYFHMAVSRDSAANKFILHQGKPAPLNGITGKLIDSSAADASSCDFGDIDNDGDLDFVVGIDGSPDLLYLNNGTRDPFLDVVPKPITSDAYRTRDIVLADFNRDGWLDIIAVTAGAETDRLYLNNGSSDPFNGVTGSNVQGTGTYANCCAAEDFNNDGHPDIVVGTGSGESLFVPWDTANNDRFATSSAIGSSSVITLALAAADFNRDGLVDVVLGDNGGYNVIFFNDGNGDPFDTSSANINDSNQYNTMAMAAADIDRDGDIDLAVCNSSEVDIIYWNAGSTPFPTTDFDIFDSDTGSFNPAVSLCDLNRDGYPEVIQGNNGQNYYYPYHPALFYNEQDALGMDAEVTLDLAVADFNSDGKPDILAVNEGGPVWLYTNTAYNTTAQYAGSLQVNTVETITDVILEPDSYPFANASANYYLSNNGGSNWYSVKPWNEFSFPAPGTDLRWRVEFSSLSPIESEKVFALTIRDPNQALGDPAEIFWGGGCSFRRAARSSNGGWLVLGITGAILVVIQTFRKEITITKTLKQNKRKKFKNQKRGIKHFLIFLILIGFSAGLSAQQAADDDDAFEMPDELKDAIFEFEERKAEPEKNTEQPAEKTEPETQRRTELDEMFNPAEEPENTHSEQTKTGAGKTMFFGLNVGNYIPSGENFSGGVGFGLLFNMDLGNDSMLDIGGYVFSIEDEQDTGSVYYDASVFAVTGCYLKFFNSFFIGGGAGFGQTSYDGLDETSGFIFGEVKTGYAFNRKNRIELRFMMPLNTENKTMTMAVGYDLLF